MIAAIYARTSKETDDAFSVSSQVDACLHYAKQHGLDVPEEYVFREDFSGKAIDRPEYNQVRELVKTGRIKVLMIHSTDRLARKMSVGEIFLDELIDHGVALHIVSWGVRARETPEDKLRFSFETVFSAFERDKIAERVIRGKIKKAESGQMIGHARPLYGYKLNEHKNGWEFGEYAPIAREILVSYGIHHIKPADIAASLQARNIPTPGMLRSEDIIELATKRYESGRISEEVYQKRLAYAESQRGYAKWLTSTIHVILKSHKVYAGEHTFTVNGQSFMVAVPPIISREESEAIARMLSVGRRRFARKPTNTEYLMARRLNCAICDLSYGVAPKPHSKVRYYYRCGSRRQRHLRGRCNSKSVKGQVVDALTRQFLRQLLLEPDRLCAWWQQQHQLEQEANEDIEEQIADIDRRITTTQQKLYRTLDRLTDKLTEDELAFYNQQKQSLTDLLAEYREDRQALAGKLIVQTVDPEVIREFAEMGEQYKEVLLTSEDFTFWRGLVDDLDLTGEIGIDEKGEVYIDFILFGKARKREQISLELEFEGNLLTRTSRNRGSRPCRATPPASVRAAC